jgi:hypothetical protein
LTLGNCEEQYPNEYFEFTNSGTIKLMDRCLTASSEPGDSVTYENCDGSVNQQFRKAGSNYLRNDSGLCLGVANDSMTLGAALQVQTCKGGLFQNWDLSNLPGAWPPAGGSVPSTAVTGATLTDKQLASVVDWIQAETSIDTTPFCYKPPGYDRGIGIAPTTCGEDQQLVNGLCYDKCRSGYHRAGTPTCWVDKATSYQPGTRCTKRDALGTCWGWAMKSCRDGYTSDHVLTCWFTGAWTYDPPPQSPSCYSNREFEAGLCYTKPRAGYSCDVTVCSPVCASGTTECGAAACANNQSSCAASITDMVISSVQLLAFIATDGAMGPATYAVTRGLQAVKAAQTANDLFQAEENLRKNIGDFMDLAEKNLGDVSTPDVANQVAAHYVKDSANYRYIAREWASRLLIMSILDLQKSLTDIMISQLDPTGVYGVVNAFAKPPCTRHTTMPQY